MQEIAISKFKAKCLALLKRVCKTKKPIRITRLGRPVAEVFPPSHPQKYRLGPIDGREYRVSGIAPAIDESDLEALR